jgi:hypothetical protein
MQLIRTAFDHDSNGSLDERERALARIILYGQSFGGAAVVKLARQLKRVDVPVLLTVQVDSIGRGDKVIPSNVAFSANLFQRDGLIIKGEREIRPEDLKKTTIIGNFKFDYSGKKIDLSEVSWLKRLFQAAHTKMDHDPEVWAVVESCILNVMAALQSYRVTPADPTRPPTSSFLLEFRVLGNFQMVIPAPEASIPACSFATKILCPY